jgi:hypothetical protein
VEAQAKKLPNLMDRETLQDLKYAARCHEDSVDNESWKDAFKQFANVADRLDAMIARTEICSCQFDK